MVLPPSEWRHKLSDRQVALHALTEFTDTTLTLNGRQAFLLFQQLEANQSTIIIFSASPTRPLPDLRVKGSY
jgi:hypothetical protein